MLMLVFSSLDKAAVDMAAIKESLKDEKHGIKMGLSTRACDDGVVSSYM